MQLTSELWIPRAFEVMPAAMLCWRRNTGKHNFAWLADEGTQNRQEESNTFYLSLVGDNGGPVFFYWCFHGCRTKVKQLHMQKKYLLIQIYTVSHHQKNFMNMNYLRLDSIMKSERIHCGLHRSITRLAREMSTPFFSPLETKAMVNREVCRSGECPFQWEWVRACLQLVRLTGVFLGQGPKVI